MSGEIKTDGEVRFEIEIVKRFVVRGRPSEEKEIQATLQKAYGAALPDFEVNLRPTEEQGDGRWVFGEELDLAGKKQRGLVRIPAVVDSINDLRKLKTFIGDRAKIKGDVGEGYILLDQRPPGSDPRVIDDRLVDSNHGGCWVDKKLFERFMRAQLAAQRGQ